MDFNALNHKMIYESIGILKMGKGIRKEKLFYKEEC